MDLLLDGTSPPKPPESWMKRYLKLIVVTATVVLALLLTVINSGDLGTVSADPLGANSRQRKKPAAKYDLTSMKVFNQTLTKVNDNYVDRRRIKPKQMLVAGLHEMERNVAEVQVQKLPGDKKLRLKVGSAEKVFTISDVNSPWSLSSRLKEILRFIQPRLRKDTKPREVEYAFINGMLSTLDPHSVLLKPETYKEMKLNTRGSFGGLGIVISMVKGVLTVMNPMKNTPADRAGIKACDKILKIGEESTVNMTLTQAVDRLRGTPGTKVEITLMRKSWPRAVRKVLTRARISVPSVSSRMLDKKIGYVRLKSFQGNSTDELRSHLGKLKQKGMKGLVLDLRGNPGGLLDQAIKISDLFIDSGTLLTTVAFAGKNKDVKKAHSSDTEPNYPMAVLVSSGSASASEIVAGALKNLDRAVIMGNRTFGKGSVQVLYDNEEDGSALKLTIAEYLTPGEVSIQAVGITPDIAIRPLVVEKEYVHVSVKDTFRREKDLAKHLDHSHKLKKNKPLRTLFYLAEDKRKKKKKNKPQSKNLCLYPDRECEPVDEDKFTMDFQIESARDLVARSRRGMRRSQMLAGAGAFFGAKKAEQEQKLASALSKLGVDWGKVLPGAGKPKLRVSVTTTPPGGKADACRELKLKVTVHNDGTGPASQLMAVSDSSNRSLKGHEFVFGKIEPGMSRSWEVPVKVRDSPTRLDDVTLNFTEANKNVPAPYTFPFSIRGADRPVFAYSYQIVDDLKGNKDGEVQRGESVRLFVRVRNSGKGQSIRTITSLKNLSGEGIFLRKGRFALGKLDSGKSKSASFTLDVRRSYTESTFKVELTVYDDGLREYTSEKLTFKVAKSKAAPARSKGFVRINAHKASFRAWAAAKAPVVGWGARGSVFRVLGKTGSWYRVLAASFRPAFIAAKDVTPGGAAGRGAFLPRWQVTPPKLVLNIPSYSTSDKRMKITGTITDETRVTDAFIFVRNPTAKVDGRKVFYISNLKGKDPRRLNLSTSIPLWPGANYVSVHARENEDVQTSETVVIFRKKVKAEKKPPEAR